MSDLTMSNDRWSADTFGSHRRKRMAEDSGRLRALLVIAAVLLAIAIGLDDKVMTQLLGPQQERYAAYEQRHLEQVASMLERDQARRAERSAQR